MTERHIHRGNSVDIEIIDGTLSLSTLVDGREYFIDIDDPADLEVLYQMIGSLIAVEYAKDVAMSEVEHEINGC